MLSGPSPASRRAVLASAVAGAAVLGSISSKASASNRPLPVNHDLALHAARRLTFGATPALVSHIRSVGLAAWLDEQLGGSTDVHGVLAAPQSVLPLPPAVMAQMASGKPLADLKAWTFGRAAWGDNQLYEVLVDFWSNHLAIYGDLVGFIKVTDDADVIRKHALGSFSDMLVASSQSPAMLHYLSNDFSIGKYPNENYARELMELHTVGVHAGYTHAMIRDAARALTGLTIDPQTFTFVFKPEWHYVGPLRVLGWSHPNADASKGLDVATSLVRYLASHPLAARRIATKLVRRFVGDPVPPGLVESAARVYLANSTAVIPTVRHIVLSPEFARSAGRKVQRPFEWLTSAVRALDLKQDKQADGTPALIALMQRLGQGPFEWPRPDGYPDTTQEWASTGLTLPRWNAAQQLAHGGIAGLTSPDATALIGSPVPTTAGPLVDRLVQRLLCQDPRPQLRAALLRSAGLSASAAITSAQAQALAPDLAALILSSPEALVR